MREAAVTVEDVGVASRMATATADVQAWVTMLRAEGAFSSAPSDAGWRELAEASLQLTHKGIADAGGLYSGGDSAQSRSLDSARHVAVGPASPAKRVTKGGRVALLECRSRSFQCTAAVEHARAGQVGRHLEQRRLVGRSLEPRRACRSQP
jgi:hypothetical protein